MEEQGLHVVQAALGGVGIFDAANAQVPFERLDLTVGEDFAQKAQAPVTVVGSVLVEGGNAAAFLSAVLKVVKAVVDMGCGVFDAIYSKNSHRL